jgi:hypothetical protein
MTLICKHVIGGEKCRGSFEVFYQGNQAAHADPGKLMTRGPISLETPPTLVRLMAYSFPNVVVTPTTSRSCLVEPQVVGGNAYLTADPARVAYYRNLVPANCIGLRWTSSCRRRVVPLLRLAPIYDRSPCSPTRAYCMTLVATGA